MLLGTLANAAAIIVGSLIGLLLHRRFPKNIQTIVFQSLGLGAILIGLQMAWHVEAILPVIFSLLIGGVIGEWLRLDDRLENLGNRIKAKVQAKDGRFTEGFVSASLLFCVGAMAVVGSLEAGLRHNHSILFTKALLDGVAAIALSVTYGVGVAFSALPIVLYQGGLTLFASKLQSIASPLMLNQLSGVGGLMIVGIGLGLLDIKKIRLANLMPALLVIIILTLLFK